MYIAEARALSLGDVRDQHAAEVVRAAHYSRSNRSVSNALGTSIITMPASTLAAVADRVDLVDPLLVQHREGGLVR